MVGRSRPAQAWSSSTTVGSSASSRRQRTFREGVAFSTVPLRLSYLDLLTHTCISWPIRGRAPLPGWPTTPTTTVTGVIEQTLRVNLSSGVTTVRDLGDRNYAVLEWRTQHAGTAAPTIVASGPPITTPRGHCANRAVRRPDRSPYAPRDITPRDHGHEGSENAELNVVAEVAPHGNLPFRHLHARHPACTSARNPQSAIRQRPVGTRQALLDTVDIGRKSAATGQGARP
jgi:hypothetical protein